MSESAFVLALSQSGCPALFSVAEKRVLAFFCLIVFVLPILGSAVALKVTSTTQPLSLITDEQQIPSLTQSINTSNDDLAMAQYFKAKGDVTQANTLLTGSAPLEPQRLAAPQTDGNSAISSISGQVESNVHKATVVMPAGTDHLFVPYSNLEDSTQIYLVLVNNRDNATIYVSTREAGKGFTLASTAILTQDVTIEWYDVK